MTQSEQATNNGVFLSYSSKNVETVRKIYNDLRQLGIPSIWMDRHNLRAGDDWKAEINSAIIEVCSHMVVCITQDSLTSVEVQYEYELASSHGKKILPVILDATPNEKLPPTLKKYNALSLIKKRDGIERDSFEDEDYENVIVELGRVLPRQFIAPDLVPIEAGSFVMGYGRHSQIVDIPQFWISKNCVTIAAYVCFIKSPIFSSEKFWLNGTYEKWEKGPYKNHWPDRDLESYALSHRKQPMYGVSWYEAMAYCRWLSYVSGHEFTLPTEAQWEKAARGTDERKWAFGNEWKPDASDVRAEKEAIQLHPKDIGIIGSESPYGCQDMIGHVWNWTSSIEFEPPYANDAQTESIALHDLHEPRVIRGGSWKQSQSKAKTYHREGQYPIPQNYAQEIGFRLVSNSPPQTSPEIDNT